MDTPDTPDAPDTPATPDTQETQEDLAVLAARLRRRVFMGAALLFALASIFVGLLGGPQLVEVVLAMAAVVCLIAALRSSSSTSV